ncbi:MAG: hypothetical protein V3U31_01185, partial [Dehalococcoidia bacterium]
NIRIRGARQVSIIGNHIFDAGTGVGSVDNILLDDDPTQGRATEDVLIADNLIGNRGHATSRYGIAIQGSSRVTLGTNRFVEAGGPLRGNLWLGERARVSRNSGTATIGPGATRVTVRHQLLSTPTAADIAVWPTNDLGQATRFWTGIWTPTHFTIFVDADPGPATATFAWKGQVE